MSLLVTGCNFRSAPIEIRETLSVSSQNLAVELEKLRERESLKEWIILSTCNRVEVYADVIDPMLGALGVQDYFASRCADIAELQRHLYRYEGEEAVRHLFRVASSLDSLVVGEAQISGQVKEALHVALTKGVAGKVLHGYFQRAFNVAKRVRTETEIARHHASVPSVAIELVGRVFENYEPLSVMIVGAGEMAELAVQHLIGRGVSRIRIANRGYDRACALAERVSASAIEFSSMTDHLSWADVIVCSTGSASPILTRLELVDAMKRRKQRPLVIVDIAIPRDVEAEVRDLENVFLFDIDDLKQIVSENLRARQKEAEKAEQLIEKDIAEFHQWLTQQNAVPVIRELRSRFTQVVKQEAERAAKQMGINGGQERKLFETMTDAIVNKLLHVPTVNLKHSVAEDSDEDLVAATCKLFGLDEPALSESIANEDSPHKGNHET